MTDESDGPTWPPMFSGMQEMSEQAMETQQEMLSRMMQAGAGGLDMNQLGAMSQTATFKTRVQSGGRISIPDAEREALDIEEGDIVQTVVIPVKRNRE
ncbi:AbrB/MazE/SpoVT family DNA-binding domain-containing protein [Halosimplex litoreum]|uniref:AbrB/MazE/SpoVT family DNA-binding domain-containing protein n=1 Tax=Halosimplex litoreum TaxID=1198301 RepID=A0A7T3FVB3_9EURY|nr:AbrB/MazE/SpoVT family DNA-binding domain-containing protein [Halosimplex litoreum]QPV61396.1 AbrB/MazE/SpoVT family DNA-binding domain-containing protein [Halosimplex litoreum]